MQLVAVVKVKVAFTLAETVLLWLAGMVRTVEVVRILLVRKWRMNLDCMI